MVLFQNWKNAQEASEINLMKLDRQQQQNLQLGQASFKFSSSEPVNLIFSADLYADAGRTLWPKIGIFCPGLFFSTADKSKALMDEINDLNERLNRSETVGYPFSNFTVWMYSFVNGRHAPLLSGSLKHRRPSTPSFKKYVFCLCRALRLLTISPLCRRVKQAC
jgi:hypothetical protein